MIALKSTAGSRASYARFVAGNSPVWGPVETCTKFPSESQLLLYILRTPPVSSLSVKGPLEFAELEYTEGRLRYRLPEGVKFLHFEVANSAGTDTYSVRVSETGDGSCTCADWRYRHSEDGTPCKHMRSVLSYLPTLRGDVYFDVDEVEDF